MNMVSQDLLWRMRCEWGARGRSKGGSFPERIPAAPGRSKEGLDPEGTQATTGERTVSGTVAVLALKLAPLVLRMFRMVQTFLYVEKRLLLMMPLSLEMSLKKQESRRRILTQLLLHGKRTPRAPIGR